MAIMTSKVKLFACITVFLISGIVRAGPDLKDLDMCNIPSHIELDRGMQVRGYDTHKLVIKEVVFHEPGSNEQGKSQHAVLLLSENLSRCSLGKVRSVLELGALNEKSGEWIEFACEWKKTKATKINDHLIGLVNAKSSYKGHYINPYKAWRIKTEQSSPQFLPVDANLVQCAREAVD